LTFGFAEFIMLLNKKFIAKFKRVKTKSGKSTCAHPRREGPSAAGSGPGKESREVRP